MAIRVPWLSGLSLDNLRLVEVCPRPASRASRPHALYQPAFTQKPRSCTAWAALTPTDRITLSLNNYTADLYTVEELGAPQTNITPFCALLESALH